MARSAGDAPPVRIVLHTGTLDCGNVGDVAMLQACTSRLAALWPSTDIAVITADERQLRRHCPEVRGVPVEGFSAWTSDRYLTGRAERTLPDPLAGLLISAGRTLRRRWPDTAARMVAARGRLLSHDLEPLRIFLEEVRRADLVIACGQGTLTEAAMADAVGLLALMESGAARGIPAVMMGQGVGPITSRSLRRRMQQALPSVDLIAVRERRRGPALLASLGIPASRVVLTGDDAIEQAFSARPSSTGRGIGLNLRIAEAAAVDASWIDRLRRVVHALADRYEAPLVPLPISNHSAGTRDADVLRLLLDARNLDAGESLDTPDAVIEQAGLCRIVITGAYHAAVFSLAQGIPTVCLASSQYVLDKMYGLEDLFGSGCRVVELTDRSADQRIESAADQLWTSVDQLRPQLLAAARRQIGLGHDAYTRLGTLVRAPHAALSWS